MAEAEERGGRGGILCAPDFPHVARKAAAQSAARVCCMGLLHGRPGLSGYYPDITAIRILSRYYPDTYVLCFMLYHVMSGVLDSIIFHSTPFWERERIRILPRGAP